MIYKLNELRTENRTGDIPDPEGGFMSDGIMRRFVFLDVQFGERNIQKWYDENNTDTAKDFAALTGTDKQQINNVVERLGNELKKII
jgi:hypothetical protein